MGLGHKQGGVSIVRQNKLKSDFFLKNFVFLVAQGPKGDVSIVRQNKLKSENFF